MIVHLFEDEKFVDTTIDKFEEIAEGENKYIVFSNSEELAHPKQRDKILIYPNVWNKVDIDAVYEDCSLLIVHYMTPIKSYIVKNKPDKVNVFWIVWGGDAYDNFKDFELYEPCTKRLIHKSFKERVKSSYLYDIYHLIKYGVRSLNKEKKTLANIDYIGTVLPPEFELIKQEFDLNVTYLEFNYDSLKNLFEENKVYILEKNILIGNSATPSNNHLDVFETIKETNNLIIVPLNYGDLDYGDIIIKEGIKKYGNFFKPLTEFLPIEEYQKLVLSCNTMVMHHLRQQGLGNILLALFIGIRVYLNKKSITYQYLKDIGIHVFNLEDDINLLGVELLEDEKINNARIVKAYWGSEKILKKTANIVKLHNALK